MKPIVHPPDVVLRAYADLVNHVFLDIRGRSNYLDDERESLHDLADAMHNIGSIFAEYGTWTDDEKYREIYLRRFDRKWSGRGPRLEEFLQSRLDEYSIQ